MIATSYPSLDEFYAGQRSRRHSRERDVGLMWRGAEGVSFRAAWVQETGEVYLVMHGHPADGGGIVHVLDRRFGLAELLSAVNGYPEVCGRAGSLRWFLERTAAPMRVAA